MTMNDTAKMKTTTSAASDWSFNDAALTAMLEKARELRPLLMEQADEAEKQRCLTDDVVAALKKEKMFQLLIPKRLGGPGMSATAMALILAEIAKGDPSAAWVCQILNGTTWMGTLTSDAIQEELFGNGIPQNCGVFMPPGKALLTEGGYRVTGAWKYASGCKQADWAQVGVMRENADGSFTPGNFVFIPMSELTIEDTWYVTGMQASASDTIAANDVFVPEHRLVPFEKSFGVHDEGKKNVGAPSDYFPIVSLLRVTGLGLLVGSAEAALEIVIDSVTRKPVVTTRYARAADSQVFQHDLGEAAAKIRTARLLLERGTRAIDQAVLDRRPVDVQERATYKAEGGVAVELLSDAMDKLMFLSGSSAFMLSNPLQRYWRDYSMGARHITHLPNINYELHGAYLSGEESIIPGDAF